MKKHALQKHTVLSTGYGKLQLQYRCQVELPSAHLMPTERMSPKDKRRRLSARRTSGTKDAAIASAASSSSALSPGDSGREAQVKLTAQRLDLRPGLGSRGVPSIPQPLESPASQPHMHAGVVESPAVLRPTEHRAIDQFSQRDHSHGLSEKFQRHQQAGGQSTSYRNGNARSCDAQGLRNWSRHGAISLQHATTRHSSFSRRASGVGTQ